MNVHGGLRMSEDPTPVGRNKAEYLLFKGIVHEK